jgi:signal peptidase I
LGTVFQRHFFEGADAMGDLIRTGIMYVAVMALIVVGTHFFKNRARVEFAPNDLSMSRSFTAGSSYPVDTSPSSIKQLKRDDIVAYWLPDEPAKSRVARIVAMEGDRIKSDAEGFYFNGTKTSFKFQKPDWRFPELRVPRGCVFVLADQPELGKDSIQTGPLPSYQIIGKLQPGMTQ